MDFYGWIQLILFILVLALVTKPLGLYLVRVLDARGKTFLDPVLGPLERRLYRLWRLDPQKEQDWKAYALSLLAFSGMGLLFTYALLRLQHLLPLNPGGFGPVNPDLAFNTAVSFTTNTNWQNYAGETTLSYFSQMVGLTFHNFVSAAAGIAAAAALVRGITRHSAKTIGNFWVDLVRVNLYLLLPFCLIFAVFLASQGVIQNFNPAESVKILDSAPIQPTGNHAPGAGVDGKSISPETHSTETQALAQGPVASQVAIKILGTNGGGFFNANASHPYENPTPLSNFIQMLAIFLIPSGLTYYLGRKADNQRHGWAVWAAMLILFLAAVLVCWRAESAGNPKWQALGMDAADGNMEGKEVRFGVFNSALFASVTTDASCGAVNALHDSFTPLGGLILLFNMQLGEVVFGGVGSGLYGILLFVILTIFLTGLMIGRTPEYLGKKIETYDVKVCVLALLILIFSILGFSAWASASSWGTAGLHNGGPHGLSEILYAFSSATANNGSAFAGLNANTTRYNIALSLAMLFGRFIMIVPVLALAGSLAGKKRIPSKGTGFPVGGVLFTTVLIGTILIVGALTFLPALALGPIVEHFLMIGTKALY